MEALRHHWTAAILVFVGFMLGFFAAIDLHYVPPHPCAVTFQN